MPIKCDAIGGKICINCGDCVAENPHRTVEMSPLKLSKEIYRLKDEEIAEYQQTVLNLYDFILTNTEYSRQDVDEWIRTQATEQVKKESE